MRLVNLLGALLIAAGVILILGSFWLIGAAASFGGGPAETRVVLLFALLGLLILGAGAYLVRLSGKSDAFTRPAEKP